MAKRKALTGSAVKGSKVGRPVRYFAVLLYGHMLYLNILMLLTFHLLLNNVSTNCPNRINSHITFNLRKIHKKCLQPGLLILAQISTNRLSAGVLPPQPKGQLARLPNWFRRDATEGKGREGEGRKAKWEVTLLILVGAPSAIALLQHEIPFLPPLRTIRPYTVSSAT